MKCRNWICVFLLSGMLYACGNMESNKQDTEMEERYDNARSPGTIRKDNQSLDDTSGQNFGVDTSAVQQNTGRDRR